MKTIVPAAGDCSLLIYKGDGYDPEYRKELVIAWAIEADPARKWCVCVTPITPKGRARKRLLRLGGVTSRQHGH
jgi:hypothetical protein